MNLTQIGYLVRQRRAALGLSQAQLARLAGLSRATINQLETGALVDLGVSKLSSLMNLVGLHLEACPRQAPGGGLRMASRTASVSYRSPLGADQLAQLLATGELPDRFLAHVSTLLDEAPLPVLLAAVEEAAQRQGVPPKRIWRHISRWAQALQSPRPVWA